MTETTPSEQLAAQLDKTFDPAVIEKKWYAHWEAPGDGKPSLFRPERPEAVPFTIVNPPPNVTGSLHIGHALDNTLQDIVIRYERLRGKDALWVVGTDHAGIATQMVVERQLEARGDKRTNYSREDFIAKVWEWKAESGGTITRQLRRLGCSMDWSREQFTMDPHFTRAVVKVFVDLYNQGLIYRDKRLVNWDPKLKTAISDLEVETREIAGSFWHFRYPLADGVTLAAENGVEGRDYIVVATTRPETMLADMAVAVNPDDERYASVVGSHVILPITGRRVPIVADAHADPEKGSGAVKITPGHDFDDFEVGKRAGIKPADMLNMLDAEANVVQTSDGLISAEFVGLERFAARKLVVERMKAEGFLVPHVNKGKDGEPVEIDAEPRTIQTPYGDRGGVVIEPWLTDQWYVNAEELAKAPIEAVKSGAIEIAPKSWEKTFFNWMENIQPWCVSRQLWWGHRIPAWYGPKVEKSTSGARFSGFDITAGKLPQINDAHIFVANAETEMEEQFHTVYGPNTRIKLCNDWEEYRQWFVRLLADPNHPGRSLNEVPIVRDTDVLDTWFSSALWPFATLGWPDDTALVARHYPNDLLISGFDILFFWDARMAMQGLHFMSEGGRRPLKDSVPWKRLYLHGLVRAADGQKMSKSKGNVVDPLGLIDQYGADALRFFMAAMESQGRDVKMDERRVEGYRNFATKLWNAARFCEANGIGGSATLAAPAAALAVNKWIIGEVVETVAALDQAMAELRFDAAANTIYHFVWDQFCDWYIELIKGSFDAETKLVAGWVLDQILVMLHPFMPFVTEELWSKLGARESELIVARWPQPGASVDAAAKTEVEWLINFVREIRSTRTEMNVPPSARTEILVHNDTARVGLAVNYNPWLDLEPRMRLLGPAIYRLARIDSIHFAMSGQAFYTQSGDAIDRVAYSFEGKRAFQIVVDDVTYSVPIEGIIDIAAEKARLAKALAASEKERDSLAKRLDNPAFVEKAKPEAIDKARADHAAHAAEAERLAAALARLG